MIAINTLVLLVVKDLKVTEPTTHMKNHLLSLEVKVKLLSPKHLKVSHKNLAILVPKFILVAQMLSTHLCLMKV